MGSRLTHTVAVLFAAVLLSACAREEVREEAEAPALPDTTAEAVWAYLQDAGYADNWDMWPGKTALYPGTEPHGMLLTTYVNQAAHDALADWNQSMPAGAIIVKENYMPDSTLAAVTVMYKAAGYNPEHADWWFMKRNADGTVEASGRVEGCQNCHGAAKANDYIMTAIGQ
jgi:hypothetical protein